MSRLALFLVLSLLALIPLASADIPRLISLQGRLTDASDNPISSSSNFAFRIYDAPTGGSPLWTEFQTLSPNSLGIFSALLGSVAALNIPFNESYWLEVQVNSEVLSPRQRMGSAGYAIRAESPWNTTGDDIYTTNAGNVGIGLANPLGKLHVSGGDAIFGGNVGIGTTGPAAKLDVSGNIKIADGTQGANKVLTSDANGVASWQTVGGGVPSGAVMFFNLASCPSGWTELTSARGRYVVGLPSGGTLAGTDGTALTNLEDRPVGQHTHTLPRIQSGSNACGWGYRWDGGGGAWWSCPGGTVDAAGSVAGTNAPYIQLLVCQKS